MKKLLKDYELQTIEQYYHMIIDSVINGQRTQAKELFSKMPKEYKKGYIRWVIDLLYDPELKMNYIRKDDLNMFIDEL